MELRTPTDPPARATGASLPGLGLVVSGGVHGSVLLALLLVGMASVQSDDPGAGVVIEMQWDGGPEGSAIALAPAPQPIAPQPITPPVDVQPEPVAPAPTVPAPASEDAAPAEPAPAEAMPPELLPESADATELAPPQAEPESAEEQPPPTATAPARPAPVRPAAPARPARAAPPALPLVGSGFSLAAPGKSDPANSADSFLAGYLDPPRLLYRPLQPPYPPAALRQNRRGSPVVNIELDAEGEILGVRLLKSSGFADLDAAALNFVRIWKFAPATRNGKPIAANLEQTIHFRPEDVRR